MLYVANAGEDTISVVDTQTNRETGRIALRTSPLDKAKGPRRLCERNGALYCINAYDSTMSILCNGENECIGVGAYPYDICAMEDSVLVCCGETDSIWRIGDDFIEVIPSQSFPCSIERCGHQLIVANMISFDVTILDEEVKLTSVIPVKNAPAFALMNQEHVFCAEMNDYGQHGLVSVMTHNGKLIKKIPVGPMPLTMRLLGKQKMLVANTGNSTLSIIDLSSLECVGSIPCGAMPDDILVHDEAGIFYVSCMMEQSVSVFDFSYNLLDSISVGQEPRGLLYSETDLF